MKFIPTLLVAVALLFAPAAEAKKAAAPAAKPAATQPAANMVSINSTSRKYHEAGCRYYDCGACVRVTLAEALRQGGVPCKKCH